MNTDVTAERYAQAIFGIGRDTGKLASFQQNAEDFLRILQSSKALSTALSHPTIERRKRRAIADGVLAKCDYDKDFANFIRLIVERGRMTHYAAIVSSMSALRDEAEGRLRGTAYSAHPLTADQRQRLTAKVRAATGHEVKLKEVVDPSVIGGLRVEIAGKVYDGTVRRELEKMREAILHASEHAQTGR